MNVYKFSLTAAALAVLWCNGGCAQEPFVSDLPPLEDSTAMFNGKNLEGWVLVNTPSDTWSFEDGRLICTGKPIGELRTAKMYQNFVLDLEWRHMKPGGNAGVFVWADDITARGVPFHRGIEVQVLENAYGNNRSHTTHGDIFPIHGATMKPENGRGGSRAFPTENRSNPSPQWNHYRITCKDGDISLAVNGKVVTRGTQCSPRKGYICLESEGGVVHYRNVRIKELPGGEVDPQHVAIGNRGYTSIYSGLDLRGWKSDGKGDWSANDWVLGYRGSEAGRLVAEPSVLPSSKDWGFVVDVRAKAQTKLVRLEFGAAPQTSGLNVVSGTQIDGLEPVGRWNRLEGTIRDGTLSIKANGKPWRSDTKLSSSDGFALVADGEVDFANLYVRPLK